MVILQYTHVSLHCTPRTNILYVNYISIRKSDVYLVIVFLLLPLAQQNQREVKVALH